MGRFAYGRLRTEAIAKYGLSWIDDDDASFVVICGTIGSFLVWPVAAIGFVIFGNPPKTAEELKQENLEQAEYIAQLEREAGMK